VLFRSFRKVGSCCTTIAIVGFDPWALTAERRVRSRLLGSAMSDREEFPKLPNPTRVYWIVGALLVLGAATLLGQCALS
jgi:hypothetical protein